MNHLKSISGVTLLLLVLISNVFAVDSISGPKVEFESTIKEKLKDKTDLAFEVYISEIIRQITVEMDQDPDKFKDLS